MKKFLASLLSFGLILSMAACGPKIDIEPGGNTSVDTNKTQLYVGVYRIFRRCGKNTHDVVFAVKYDFFDFIVLDR